MHDLLEIALTTIPAKLAGELTQRLGQSPMLGQGLWMVGGNNMGSDAWELERTTT
jgi:hypothetical protein